MTQRTLGIVAGVLAVLFLLTWIAAGLASVVAGIGPREAMSLAIDVQTMIEQEGLDAARERPLRPTAALAPVRVVVTDVGGVIVASWPQGLAGQRLELRWPDGRELSGGPATSGLPAPQAVAYQQGRLVRTQTGRILFDDAPAGRHASGALIPRAAQDPSGQTYYVFAAAAPWVFAGLADTEWNFLLEQIALLEYFLLAGALAWWVARDARAYDLAPELGWALLTFIVGPIGWLGYRLRRSVLRACPHCGRPVHQSYACCPHCGVQLRPLCSTCGSPVQGDWAYCARCTEPLHV